MSRKIAVITGTRAEYGLLYWCMRELQACGVELQLIVTGAHLSHEHGYTVAQIEADGFPISARVDMKLGSDAPVDIARSMGLCVSGIADTLDRLKPDMAVILGDRYEMLAAASAATAMMVPVAHIHGGEVTEGAMDESIRHAITKLSYWHFAASEPYAKRIIQLGENPSRVFNVGAPGIDNIVRLPLLSVAELEKELGIPLRVPVMLCTYHPETLSLLSASEQIHILIEALDAFPDATLIVTGANADTGGRAINDALQACVARHRNAVFRISLGSLKYISLMKQADVVVGNSSSGMMEAPVMGRPTVNIGNRQKGRLRSQGIIDCACNAPEIIAGISCALSPEFKKSLIPSYLFGIPGQVAPRIAEMLSSLPIPRPAIKPFYNLP